MTKDPVDPAEIKSPSLVQGRRPADQTLDQRIRYRDENDDDTSDIASVKIIAGKDCYRVTVVDWLDWLDDIVRYCNPHQPGLLFIDGKNPPESFEPDALDVAIYACWRVVMFSDAASAQQIDAERLVKVTIREKRLIGVIETTEAHCAACAEYVEKFERFGVVK